MNAASEFFRDAEQVQKVPISEAQLRDATECLERLDVYRKSYNDMIAALSNQSGIESASIRQVIKARLDSCEQDLIDKVQGTIDLLGSFAGGGE